MGGWLSLWAHWGILRRSEAWHDLTLRPKSRGRLFTTLTLAALAVAGGITLAVTNSFPVVMGFFGAFFGLFLLGFIPAYAWHVAKEESIQSK